MLAAAVPIVWGGTGLVSRIALRVAGEGEKNSSRWRKFVLELSESGLLDSKLGCKLLLISSLRFIVLVLMAGETTAAIGSTLPTWQLAVTMPFVVLSASLGITPGGLGLTEFTYATVLSLFGTPLAATSEWAIANRLLTAAASLIVGLVGVALLVARAPKNDKVTATEPEPAVHV